VQVVDDPGDEETVADVAARVEELTDEYPLYE